MRVQIVGKGVELSDALNARVTEKVTEYVNKYFGRPGDAMVTFSRGGRSFFRVDCSVHLPSGAMLTAGSQAEDAYVAADEMLARLETRLRRYSRRIKDHHAAARTANRLEQTAVYVIQSAADSTAEDTDADSDTGGGAGGDPVIIAETAGELQIMPVSDAVQEMDVADSPFLLFRNAAHGELNVVYRRPDGHIGWIDPKRSGQTR